mmetsp:Transcript_2953/g.8000  ORF Transcript_2953/g.8000 Transcript_2953/m.8000 type:complete len:290 (+) Transcript_2953:844-1713(+)
MRARSGGGRRSRGRPAGARLAVAPAVDQRQERVDEHLRCDQHAVQLVCRLARRRTQVRLHSIPRAHRVSQHRHRGRRVHAQQNLQRGVRPPQPGVRERRLRHAPLARKVSNLPEQQRPQQLRAWLFGRRRVGQGRRQMAASRRERVAAKHAAQVDERLVAGRQRVVRRKLAAKTAAGAADDTAAAGRRKCLRGRQRRRRRRRAWAVRCDSCGRHEQIRKRAAEFSDAVEHVHKRAVQAVPLAQPDDPVQVHAVYIQVQHAALHSIHAPQPRAVVYQRRYHLWPERTHLA